MLETSTLSVVSIRYSTSFHALPCSSGISFPTENADRRIHQYIEDSRENDVSSDSAPVSLISAEGCGECVALGIDSVKDVNDR